ncbi:MAG: MFS transporter [Rhodospirillales bacterium]
MKRKATLATGGFAHFVHDGFTDSMYVLFPFWAEAFGLSLSQVGFLKMCSSSALASFQLPAGLLAERFGERAVLSAGTVVAGACFALLGLASGFAALAVILIAFGVGCGTQHPLASSVVSRAYDSGGRRAAIGAYNFSGDLGKVAVPASVTAGAVAIGWRESTIAYGMVCVAAGIVIFLLLRHFGAGGPPLARAEFEPAAGPKTKGWGLRDRRGFALLSVISMIDTGARIAFLTFMPFLLIDKGAAVEVVGFALALVFAGGAAGKLLCGLIAERVGVIRTTIFTEIATVGLILVLITLPLMPALFLLPVFGVVLNGTSSVLYGTVGDFVDPDHQSRAFGLFYTLGIGTGALTPVAFGVLSDLSDLETTLTVLAATLLASVPLCWLLRPSLAAVGVERAKATFS